MVLKRKVKKSDRGPASSEDVRPVDGHKAPNGKGRSKHAKRGKGKGKGSGRLQGMNDRKLRRNDEEKEIKELEVRIAAEAPARGRGGLGDAATQKEEGDGPALTTQLFRDLPISRRTKRGLVEAQFQQMTEIQRGAILPALAGRDILGEARTGSGKTLAFLIPLIELLFRQRWTQMDGLGALIVSPTRELAYQIFQVLASVAKEHDFSAGCIVGGRSLEDEQLSIVKMSILVATPGRLLQHLDESPGFEVSGLQMLVFDEADRILDFGFQETVHHILGHLPAERQTLLFSATLRASVQRLGRAALRNPEVVSVHQGAQSRTPERLKQVYMVLPLEQKVNYLFSFLRTHSQKKMIVFVSSCKQVRFLYEAFRRLKPGPAVMELHGRQSLTKRLIVFQEFTERERAVALLCTDVAARGVDFPAVDWVIQMDCPDSVDSYIHRVGRTARYQSSGHSALFLLKSEEAFITKLVEAHIGVKGISPKKGKLIDIQRKLMALLAEDAAIRHLAQKAFVSYIRSIMLMKDKDIFDAKALPRDAFAESLGLVDSPEISELGGGVDVEKNPLKMKKNQTALQRFREKIKQKKQERKAAAEGKDSGAAPPDETDEDAKFEQDKAKKPGRWERRQRRIQRAVAEKSAVSTKAEDDLLEVVEKPDNELPAVTVQTAVKQRKMKLRSDGVAVGAKGKHTFFTGNEGRAANELAAVAEELGGDEEQPSAGSGDRQAFLRNVAKTLAERDAADVASNRARVQEQHKKRRWKEREMRSGAAREDEPQLAVEFGSPSGGDSDADDHTEPMRESPSPEKRRPPGSKRRRLASDRAEESIPEFGKNKVSSVVATGGDGSRDTSLFAATFDDDVLGKLEREALGRLGGGGLFS